MPSEPSITADDFKESLSWWAATVCLVAVRDGDGPVYGTTVTSFAPLSADPPEVVICLGAGAQVLPFLDPGTPFVVNLLDRSQAALATRYADPYPVGPSPFPEEGDPVVGGALVSLSCRVRTVHPEGATRIVVARVESTTGATGRSPLLWYRRRATGLGDAPPGA
jgi:flavin reductase (DIM6/NTAB) family NADH-FMN oxidoreductase RutF